MQRGQKRYPKSMQPLRHVDRMIMPQGNMSTGSCSNMSTGFLHFMETSRLDLETRRQHCCRSACRRNSSRSKNRALHSLTKSSISFNPGGILRCGQKRNCSQQAKEQIGLKITEIARVELQISWKNRGAGQLCTVSVFRL